MQRPSCFGRSTVPHLISELAKRPLLLLVEDDPAIVHVLGATLAFGGYDSHSVASGREALNRIDTDQYCALLLDLHLPDLGGSELVRMVRERTAAPILVLSDQVSPDASVSALDAGADDFIQKPFLPAELLARIRAALRRGGTGDEPGPYRHAKAG